MDRSIWSWDSLETLTQRVGESWSNGLALGVAMAKVRRAAEEKAFLQAIMQNPDDDMTRLVYADWLEDRGDSRGELIRIQVEKEDEPHWTPRYFDLLQREGQILGSHGATWRKEVAKWARQEGKFRKGFLSEIHTTVGQLSRSGAALLRAVPVVSLHLRGSRDHWERIIDSGLLKSVSELHLVREWLDGKHLRKLFESDQRPRSLRKLQLRLTAAGDEELVKHVDDPMLAGLRSLSLQSSGSRQPGVSGLQAVAQSENLSQLASLELYRYGMMTQEWLHALRESRFHALRRLDIPVTGSVRPEDVTALLRSSSMAQLEDLTLWERGMLSLGFLEILRDYQGPALRALRIPQARIRKEGCTVLGQSGLTEELEELNLAYNDLDDDACKLLADCSFRKLRSVILAKNLIQKKGLLALAGSSMFSNLISLDLSSNPKSSKAFDQFFAALPGDQLRSLTLSQCRLGAEGIKAIAESPKLRNLYRLELSGNGLQDEGIAQLAASKHLHSLGELNLIGNTIGAKGMKALAQSPILQGVHTLSLGVNRFGNDGLKALRESPYLSSLTTLNVLYCGIWASELEALEKELDIKVIY